jgi:predicted dehydrogenase
MQTVSIGIIGLGWMGSEHARNLLANPVARLAGIADPNRENVSGFLEKSRFQCPSFDDFRQLLKADIDAVVIASPNAMHAGMCIEAAEAGKHIFCEKPMAITLDDCRRVRDAVKRAGVKYLIGYHRRLNPLYQYAKGLLESGALGRAFLVESDYLHYVPGDLPIWSWLGKKDVAGSIFHAGSGHNVDLIRYLCGDIAEVMCYKDAFLPRTSQVETEDTALAIFRFRNGALGKVHCCVGPIVPFTFNFKLYGTKGSVINHRVWLDSMPRFDQAGHEDNCIELPRSWIPDNVQGGISEPWNKLIDHFVDMLTSDIVCLNDVDSAYQTSAACFAALASADTGRAVQIGD